MCDWDCGKCDKCKREQEECKESSLRAEKENKIIEEEKKKKEMKEWSLKRKFENIYLTELDTLLERQEKEKGIKDLGMKRRKTIKEIEKLVIEYHDIIKK